MEESLNEMGENKILILYILKKVGKPLAHKELLELTLSVADINYFYFQQYLTDLLEDNYIRKYNHTDNNELELYELTKEGARCSRTNNRFNPAELQN